MTDAGPVPLAGPVFTDWYREAFFYALLYGPPILAVAGALYLLGRFTRLRGWRALRAAIALVLAPTLVIGGVAVAATVEHRRTESADARSVTFTVYVAPGFHPDRGRRVRRNRGRRAGARRRPAPRRRRRHPLGAMKILRLRADVWYK